MYVFDGRIDLENRGILEEYLNGYEYKASGMSFTSLFMWKDINTFSWEIIGDYMCITGSDNLYPTNDEPFMLAPLTRTGEYDPKKLRETVLEAKARFEKIGKKFNMMLVPFHLFEQLIIAMPGELEFTADRPNYDYVYEKKDLIELKGRAIHSKKNHLNYFLNHYPDYEFGKLTPEMADEAMEFIREFNERKDLQDPHELSLLMDEERAMRDVFSHLDEVGYLSGVIRINGKIEALCVGGRLGRKTIVVHIEKANIEYRGLYQCINNEFCKSLPANITRINREEDMGLPGLRKAKLSYNPLKLVEKYSILVKK